MNTAQLIRALDQEIRLRIQTAITAVQHSSGGGGINPPEAMVRELALDFHQALVDAAESGVEAAVTKFIGGDPL